MNDIDNLQNIVLDQTKLGALVRETSTNDLKQLLTIKDGQVSHLRRGARKPSADGLLRLMLLYKLSPADIAIKQ